MDEPRPTISLAATDAEIAACYPVLRELRPYISAAEFVPRIRRQEQMGYRLAAVQVAGQVVAVAGFRISENLPWGRFLYVDDLVTHAEHRSKGYGAQLLAWLKEFAAQEGCVQLHLDSATWRKDAHRFYEREGLQLSSFHFFTPITGPAAGQMAPAGEALGGETDHASD